MNGWILTPCDFKEASVYTTLLCQSQSLIQGITTL